MTRRWRGEAAAGNEQSSTKEKCMECVVCVFCQEKEKKKFGVGSPSPCCCLRLSSATAARRYVRVCVHVPDALLLVIVITRVGVLCATRDAIRTTNHRLDSSLSIVPWLGCSATCAGTTRQTDRSIALGWMGRGYADQQLSIHATDLMAVPTYQLLVSLTGTCLS